jgi:predicted Zn-dependent protease
MPPLRSLLSLSLFTLLAGAALAVPTVPNKYQIERWIKDLGDDTLSVRETASRKLWEAGRFAEEAVKEALKSSNPEVSRRASELHDKFQWGLYPDTPKDVADLVAKYKAADLQGRTAQLNQLPTAGPVGYRLLARIAKGETNPNLRSFLFAKLDSLMPRAARELSAEPESVEQLLQLGLERQPAPLFTHYAAYWLRKGRLEERIKYHQAHANKDAGGRRHAEVLAYLYRARGDLKAARSAAEVAGDEALTEALAFEAGDWNMLADLTNVQGVTPMEKLTNRAVYQRLAGKTKELAETLAEIKKLGVAVEQRGEGRFLAAKPLFLNDAADAGIEVLAESNHQRLRFDILCARSRFKEALAAADREMSPEWPELEALEIRIARLRYQMGEKDEALKTLDRYGKFVGAVKIVFWTEEFFDAEYRLGLTDRADAHLAAELSLDRAAPIELRYLGRAFPGKEEIAREWWHLLRKETPGEKPHETMKTLRGLLTGQLDAKTATALIVKASTTKEIDQLQQADAFDRRQAALAEAARVAGQDKLAQAFLEKTSTFTGRLRLADFLAEKKDWPKAAEVYGEAAKKNLDDPLPLLLQGRALVEAGKEKEGKALIDQAHDLPLGDFRARHNLAAALVRRGLAAEAQRETDWLLRLAPPRAYELGEAMRRNSRAALARKDYKTALEDQERAMFVILRPGISFLDPRRYVIEPAYLHRLRAQLLLQAGKLAEAQREIAAAFAATPGGLDLPIVLVPQLERLGYRKEATDLFEKVLAVQEGVCKEYPRYATAHNEVAWLAACCRRELHKGLKHARLAVELEPGSSVHLDTLAEVYFQQGEKDKALAAIKKAVELTPQRVYYRKQLQRMEAGDRDAERPVDE